MNRLSSTVVQNARPVRAAPVWLTRAAAAVFGALRAAGQARARAELLGYADRCASLQPQLAAELRAASARLGAG